MSLHIIIIIIITADIIIIIIMMQPYTILARTYLRTASTLQCPQTLDPFTVMHTYTEM